MIRLSQSAVVVMLLLGCLGCVDRQGEAAANANSHYSPSSLPPCKNSTNTICVQAPDKSSYTIPLNPATPRRDEVVIKCSQTPKGSIVVDGLFIDCPSLVSWYNMQDLNRRDEMEATK